MTCITPRAPTGETTPGWYPDSIHASARTRSGETPSLLAQAVRRACTSDGVAVSAAACGTSRCVPIRRTAAGSSLFARARRWTVVPNRAASAVSESPGRTT